MRLEIVVIGNRIQLNGKTFDFEDGVLVIDDVLLLVPKLQGITEFNRILDGNISEGDRVTFLKYLYDNSQAGIKELRENTGLLDNVITELIKVGYSTGLIVKKGQWRLVGDKKEAIGKYLEGILPKDETVKVTTTLEDFRGVIDGISEVQQDSSTAVRILKKQGRR